MPFSVHLSTFIDTIIYHIIPFYSEPPAVVSTILGAILSWCWDPRTEWTKASGECHATMGPTDKGLWKAPWTFSGPSWRSRDVGYTTSFWTFGTLDYSFQAIFFCDWNCPGIFQPLEFSGEIWSPKPVADVDHHDWPRNQLSGPRPKGCSWQLYCLRVRLTFDRNCASDVRRPWSAQTRPTLGLGILICFVWSRFAAQDLFSKSDQLNTRSNKLKKMIQIGCRTIPKDEILSSLLCFLLAPKHGVHTISLGPGR